MADEIKYCALGEEGIEFVSDSENEVKAWIYDEYVKDWFQAIVKYEDPAPAVQKGKE